nr:uncharacterized protein LOC123762459 [Procambarus clarkii]
MTSRHWDPSFEYCSLSAMTPESLTHSYLIIYSNVRIAFFCISNSHYICALLFCHHLCQTILAHFCNISVCHHCNVQPYLSLGVAPHRHSTGAGRLGGDVGGEDLYAQEGEEAARWTAFIDTFCKRTRAWAATKEALEQYRNVLTGRLDEMKKVERLRRENAELKFLLQGVVSEL